MGNIGNGILAFLLPLLLLLFLCKSCSGNIDWKYDLYPFLMGDDFFPVVYRIAFIRMQIWVWIIISCVLHEIFKCVESQSKTCNKWQIYNKSFVFHNLSKTWNWKQKKKRMTFSLWCIDGYHFSGVYLQILIG